MKQHEIRRNKGKKTKKLRKKKPKIQQQPPRCYGVFLAIFRHRTGHFLEFDNFFAHQSRLQPKVSTSTVAALFLKMALTGQRIAMVDMVLLVFLPAFPYLP